MKPGARVAAAIEILGDISDGLAAEQALTRWARSSRFAGSKDRGAIRDHVFDVMRCKRTAAHYGGGDSPRALMIGLLHQQGAEMGALFSGEGHAPAPLSDDETRFPEAPEAKAIRWNMPDWLIPQFEESLGQDAETTAIALQGRAPVFLRVNTTKTTRKDVVERLKGEGIETDLNPICDTALTVTSGARKIRNSNAYQHGLVELQDAASQAVAAAVPAGGRVLDYCAGGGGKALALAVDRTRQVFAHDIDPKRMADLPARAARAGVEVQQLTAMDAREKAPFDTVLGDAPCSGSGAWRRAAEGKWTLTAGRLAELTSMQDDILDQAAPLVAQNGTLVYATCSVLRVENEDRITEFLSRQKGWRCTFSQRYPVGPDGDGFYTAHLIRA